MPLTGSSSVLCLNRGTPYEVPEVHVGCVLAVLRLDGIRRCSPEWMLVRRTACSEAVELWSLLLLEYTASASWSGSSLASKMV